MRIENFHIQGFKSLADVKVEGLSDINMFYGLNDVGKSNIFQALALWNWTLTTIQSSRAGMSLSRLEATFGSSLFQLGRNKTIKLRVGITLNIDSSLGEVVNKRIAQRNPGLAIKDRVQVTSEIEIDSRPDEVSFLLKSWAEIAKFGRVNIPQEEIIEVLPGFHIIKAARRLQIEQKGGGNDLGPISDHNLKQALFYTYLSRDLQQKRRLEAIKRILTKPPFSLGELDIALDPATDQIDIGFARPEGRLPLENLGSGSQQLLLVLGQIFLNDYPIIAIEEPEMNLSPQYQQWLLVALRELMQDPDVKLNQLFISTHSPYFEFKENFFDVTMEQGVTQVAKLPLEKRNRYFPDTEIGQETGARLNSLNQVKLYDGVIQDLKLQRGDMVIFTKNEAGRWEIRPESEIVEELETVSDN
jgi:hypothetical protein